MLKPDTGYIVIAELTVDPSTFEEFLAGMERNASASLANEPGTHHFEIVADRANSKLTLVEGYQNQDAFRAHQSTPHFLAWRKAHVSQIVTRSSRHLQATDA